MLNLSLSTRPVIEALESRIAPATFTVTTTADSGPGSLRQAILDANALAGADTIGFDIPGDDLQVIQVLSALPAITDTIAIGATNGKVRLDGTNAGPGVNGLTVVGSGSDGTSIFGLQVADFGGSGVFITQTSNVEIRENAMFNNGLHGVYISESQAAVVNANTLGASPDIAGSTGNKGNGLLIENSSAEIGLYKISPTYRSTLGNMINSNGLFGVEFRGASKSILVGNTVRGNGALATIDKQGGGIAIIDSESIAIGGAVLLLPSEFGGFGNYDVRVAGNNITENSDVGVWVKNSVGTTVAGNAVARNTGDGIRVDASEKTNFSAEERGYAPRGTYIKTVGNTISQNSGWGVAAVNGASNTNLWKNTVDGNNFGAILFDHATNSTVGNPTRPDEGSTINFGNGTGILLKESFGIRISHNTFIGGGIPIDLNGDGITTNDLGDTDVGANHGQNYPTLTLSIPSSPNTDKELSASLATDATNTAFAIQVYHFDSASEQYTFRFAQTIITGSDGTASYKFGNYGSVSMGQRFFATATNLTTGETSEVSPVNAIASNISINSGTITEGDSGIQDIVFTVTLDTPSNVPITVNYQSQNGTAQAGEDYAAVSGRLVFAPGELSKTITVPVFGDPIKETNETFYINLTSAEVGKIKSSLGTGTIINDDQLPIVSIQDAVAFEGKPGNQLVTLTLSEPSLDPVRVRVNRTGGTAASGNDFSGFDYQEITFAPGVTSMAVPVSIYDDSTREGDETILLEFSSPTGATLGDSSAVVTIVDNDTWKLQSESVQLLEGNDGQTLASITVRLTNSFGVTTHEHPISVDFATQNGTAFASSDYVTTTGTLTFAPGEFEKTILIPVLGDNTAEQHESFFVAYSNPLGATLQRTSETVTILNDDPGSISVSSATITEGHAGSKMLLFNVDMTFPLTTPVSVDYETQAGTATAGSDFEGVSGTLTFAPGETKKTISVPILGDRIAEETESFTLKLTTSTGASIANGTGTGTITNDDPFISIANAQFLEGESPTSTPRSVFIPVRLSQATDIPVSVDFSTSNGTAEATSDYVATSGTLTFAPGQTVQYIELQLIGDQVFEVDETLTLTLANSQGAQIGQATGTVTIKTDEPFISVQGTNIVEGNSGSRALVFTVSLNQPLTSAVTVDYATADSTATEGSDYTAASGTLTFAPGETSKTISVPVLGDTLAEANETLRLLLSNVTGANLGSAEAEATIINDDVPAALPVLSFAGSSVLEGHSGTKSLVFTVNLSQASASAVSVQYATADGTATPGSDYIAASGTLTFAPGETSKTISVPVLGDTLEEANESLRLLLSNVTGATTSQAEATGFILDDDSASLPNLPHLTITGGSVREGGSGSSSLAFTVSLSAAAAWPVSVNYQHAGGSASVDFDFLGISGTLTFAPGETTKTILVPVLGDYSIEGDETVILQISDPVGATLSTSSEPTATGTILNDDLAPDAAGLVISKGGRKATWIDIDGQHVTLTATKPILTASAFHFSAAPDGSNSAVLSQLDLSSASPQGSVGLNFSVKERGGQVHIGEINAAGRDLGTVNLPGRLGAIFAGDAQLKTPAIGKLSVDSFGSDSTDGQSGASLTQSTVQGSIGSLVVKQGWVDAQLFVNAGGIGSAHIGGGLLGSSSNATSLLSVAKNIGSLQVGGNVMNSSVLVGADTEAGAKVGNVQVKGDWIASNLVVGAEAGDDGLYGTEDDTALQDTASRIAKITIRGAISGTADTERATDHFGIVAGRIAALQVGGQKMSLSAKWKDSIELGSTADLWLRELAGTARS